MIPSKPTPHNHRKMWMTLLSLILLPLMFSGCGEDNRSPVIESHSTDNLPNNSVLIPAERTDRTAGSCELIEDLTVPWSRTLAVTSTADAEDKKGGASFRNS
ncbi:MAG: hypothetical protein ACLFT2_05365 [Candidatus Brocadiia bacterium]